MTPLLLSLAWAQPSTVGISGVVSYTGSGALTAEVLLVDGEGPPLLAHSVLLERPGPFRLEVPAGLGPVRLRIAADVRSDGIGADDPQALHPEVLVVADQDLEGLELGPDRFEVARRRARLLGVGSGRRHERQHGRQHQSAHGFLSVSTG